MKTDIIYKILYILSIAVCLLKMTEMMGDAITLAKETALRLKQLELKFENLEADVKMSDCCFNELDADQEEAGNKIDRLEKRVTQLEVDLHSQQELFEERVADLHPQNVELRNHVNLLVDTVNNIMRVLNSNIEQADEGVDEVDGMQLNEEPEENEPYQQTVEQANAMKKPFFHDTLQQVYDMYQSQPRDEEGWEEMSKAIKAAEECEVCLKEQQQERVNGLTEAESSYGQAPQSDHGRIC